MNLRKVTYNFIIPCLVFQKAIIKSPQFTHLAFILVNYIISGENNQVVEVIILSTAFAVFHQFPPRNCTFYRFKTENGASFLAFTAVKKRKTHRRFLPLDMKKRALKELIDHSEARF